MIAKFLQSVKTQKQQVERTDHYRELMRREAQIGGTLFGPVPKDRRREFFCLDENTWIWHEEWINESGQQQAKTTRYDIRTDNILKAQDGQGYQQVSLDEAKNLNT